MLDNRYPHSLACTSGGDALREPTHASCDLPRAASTTATTSLPSTIPPNPTIEGCPLSCVLAAKEQMHRLGRSDNSCAHCGASSIHPHASNAPLSKPIGAAVVADDRGGGISFVNTAATMSTTASPAASPWVTLQEDAAAHAAYAAKVRQAKRLLTEFHLYQQQQQQQQQLSWSSPAHVQKACGISGSRISVPPPLQRDGGERDGSWMGTPPSTRGAAPLASTDASILARQQSSRTTLREKAIDGHTCTEKTSDVGTAAAPSLSHRLNTRDGSLAGQPSLCSSFEGVLEASAVPRSATVTSVDPMNTTVNCSSDAFNPVSFEASKHRARRLLDDNAKARKAYGEQGLLLTRAVYTQLLRHGPPASTRGVRTGEEEETADALRSASTGVSTRPSSAAPPAMNSDRVQRATERDKTVLAPTETNAVGATASASSAAAAAEAKRALDLLSGIRAMRRQTEELTMALLHACGEWGCWADTTASPQRQHLFSDLFLHASEATTARVSASEERRESSEAEHGEGGIAAALYEAEMRDRRTKACATLRKVLHVPEERREMGGEDDGTTKERVAHAPCSAWAFLELAESPFPRLLPPPPPTSTQLALFAVQQRAVRSHEAHPHLSARSPSPLSASTASQRSGRARGNASGMYKDFQHQTQDLRDQRRAAQHTFNTLRSALSIEEAVTAKVARQHPSQASSPGQVALCATPDRCALEVLATPDSNGRTQRPAGPDTLLLSPPECAVNKTRPWMDSLGGEEEGEASPLPPARPARRGTSVSAEDEAAAQRSVPDDPLSPDGLLPMLAPPLTVVDAASPDCAPCAVADRSSAAGSGGNGERRSRQSSRAKALAAAAAVAARLMSSSLSRSPATSDSEGEGHLDEAAAAAATAAEAAASLASSGGMRREEEDAGAVLAATAHPFSTISAEAANGSADQMVLPGIASTQEPVAAQDGMPASPATCGQPSATTSFAATSPPTTFTSPSGNLRCAKGACDRHCDGDGADIKDREARREPSLQHHVKSSFSSAVAENSASSSSTEASSYTASSSTSYTSSSGSTRDDESSSSVAATPQACAASWHPYLNASLSTHAGAAQAVAEAEQQHHLQEEEKAARQRHTRSARPCDTTLDTRGGLDAEVFRQLSEWVRKEQRIGTETKAGNGKGARASSALSEKELRLVDAWVSASALPMQDLSPPSVPPSLPLPAAVLRALQLLFPGRAFSSAPGTLSKQATAEVTGTQAHPRTDTLPPAREKPRTGSGEAQPGDPAVSLASIAAARAAPRDGDVRASSASRKAEAPQDAASEVSPSAVAAAAGLATDASCPSPLRDQHAASSQGNEAIDAPPPVHPHLRRTDTASDVSSRSRAHVANRTEGGGGHDKVVQAPPRKQPWLKRLLSCGGG